MARSARRQSKSLWKAVPAAASLFVLTVLAASAFFVDWRGYGIDLISWIQSLGVWGPVIFMICNLLSVVLLLPGLIFTLGGGFLFGSVEGTLYVVTGTALGAVSAFLIARLTFPRALRERLRGHTRLDALEHAMSRRGWKVVMVTRMIPLFPFKLSNYLFGLTRFRLRDFAIGTTVGIIPITLINVYIGSLARELTALGESVSRPGPLTWALYLLGLITALAGFAYLARIARASFEELTEETGVSGDPS